MNPLSVAAQVVHGATGEEILSAICLQTKGVLQDFEVVTKTRRLFTVTVNTRTSIPQGHFFEGKDPTKSRLSNFRLEGETKVVLD